MRYSCIDILAFSGYFARARWGLVSQPSVSPEPSLPCMARTSFRPKWIRNLAAVNDLLDTGFWLGDCLYQRPPSEQCTLCTSARLFQEITPTRALAAQVKDSELEREAFVRLVLQRGVAMGPAAW
jgi:hypothetical protein